MNAALNAPSEQPGRSNLVFGLGTEEYAIDIALVQELRGYDQVTRLANAPDYLKGVINLRGVIVPLIDLRIHLGLGAPTYNATTVVIILATPEQTTGIVVDSVAEVVSFEPEQIKPAPQLRHGANDYVRAVASIEQRMLIMLDIAAMLHALTMAEPEALAA
jgi:purine-binding chemotaxis protein CheW